MHDLKDHIFQVISGSGIGTGFYLTDKDLVVTNFHVVAGHREVALKDQSHGRHLARVVLANPEADLALLRSDFPKPTGGGIRVLPGVEAERTQRVHIHGFPFGLPYTVTEGIVSSTRQPVGGRYYLQTDAAINPGNSGGPILREDGVLLAVTTCKLTGAENVGFGILGEDLSAELQDLDAGIDGYHVRCNSCHCLIVEEAPFCATCGKTIERSAFETFEATPFVKFVDEALARLGMNPVLARGGPDNWEFHQGSALVRIFVLDQSYLIGHSSTNRLPKQNLQALFEYLLSRPAEPYYLGIGDNNVFVSYRVHVADVFSEHRDRISRELTNLALKADELDDWLREEYGCEMSIDARTPDGGST